MPAAQPPVAHDSGRLGHGVLDGKAAADQGLHGKDKAQGLAEADHRGGPGDAQQGTVDGLGHRRRAAARQAEEREGQGGGDDQGQQRGEQRAKEARPLGDRRRDRAAELAEELLGAGQHDKGDGRDPGDGHREDQRGVDEGAGDAVAQPPLAAHVFGQRAKGALQRADALPDADKAREERGHAGREAVDRRDHGAAALELLEQGHHHPVDVAPRDRRSGRP